MCVCVSGTNQRVAIRQTQLNVYLCGSLYMVFYTALQNFTEDNLVYLLEESVCTEFEKKVPEPFKTYICA